MFREIFLKKKINIKKLLEYGFLADGETYRYSRAIMDGEFILDVFFDRLGNADTVLTESDTDEEYSLYKTSAEGVFVGQVRGAIEAVLRDIADKCFEASEFKQEQTLRLTAYAFENYGDMPEFLWESTPGNGILRRKDSGKWYAAILTIPKSKLGYDSKQIVEIVNFHGTHEQVEKLLKRAGFYPGWHMNKKSWYTVILDGSVDDEEIFRLMAESYGLAAR